jgi:hypothetical protein
MKTKEKEMIDKMTNEILTNNPQREKMFKKCLSETWNKCQIYYDGNGNYRWQEVWNWEDYWEVKENKKEYQQALKQQHKIVPFNKQIKLFFKSPRELHIFAKEANNG